MADGFGTGGAWRTNPCVTVNPGTRTALAWLRLVCESYRSVRRAFEQRRRVILEFEFDFDPTETAVTKRQQSSLRLWFDFWRAGLEAQQVIGLRLAKLAGGGAVARAETKRMLSEKVAAALEAQTAAAAAILTGNAVQVPARTLALYRRKMRANRRRLG